MMVSRTVEALRSLVFYAVFYAGSVGFVAAAALAIAVAPNRVQPIGAGWSGFHRWCAERLLGLRVTIEGTLPAGRVLAVFKHESFFEAIDLPNLLDNPVVFAKAELLRLPLWGRVAAAYGLVGVARNEGAKALRAMVVGAREGIEAGRVLAIFPEGTRVAHGDAPPLQSGFAGLYKLLALPVVPVAVDSGPPYHRRIKRKGKITYRVGETIPPGLPRSEIEARVRAAINALNEKAAP